MKDELLLVDELLLEELKESLLDEEDRADSQCSLATFF